MKRNIRIFEGLFDKFGEEPELYDDILTPIKRELERFLCARQKSRGAPQTQVASDFGMLSFVWEPKKQSNLHILEHEIVKRIHQLDPRCRNITCRLSFAGTRIVMQLSLVAMPPLKRAPLVFDEASQNN